MPTKRQRRTRNRRAEIPAELISYFRDETGFPTLAFFLNDAEIKAAWYETKDGILKAWIVDAPGTRPSHWWKFEAPEPRRRLGGVGTASSEVLANATSYKFGIPDSFVSQSEADYYNGRAKDIHGKPIGTEYQEGHFAGVAIDPANPPQYESQATYLQRFGLLLPEELERLGAADFQPEAIEADPAEQ